MKSRNLFLIFLKQSMNRRLCFCVLITVAILSGAIIGLIDKATASVWYLLDKAMVGSGVVSLLICVIPIIPYAMSLAGEYGSGMMKLYTIRTGTAAYFTNKVIVGFVSGFATLFLSQALFVVIFMQFYPVFLTDHTYYAYETLMENGEVAKGLVMFMTHMSLSGALMAVAAVLVSAFVPNKFAAVSVPVIIYFTSSRILTVRTNLPKFIIPSYLVEGVVGIENPVTELVLKLLAVLVISVVVVIVGGMGLKRKITNT